MFSIKLKEADIDHPGYFQSKPKEINYGPGCNSSDLFSSIRIEEMNPFHDQIGHHLEGYESGRYSNNSLSENYQEDLDQVDEDRHDEAEVTFGAIGNPKVRNYCNLFLIQQLFNQREEDYRYKDIQEGNLEEDVRNTSQKDFHEFMQELKSSNRVDENVDDLQYQQNDSKKSSFKVSLEKRRGGPFLDTMKMEKFQDSLPQIYSSPPNEKYEDEIEYNMSIKENQPVMFFNSTSESHVTLTDTLPADNLMQNLSDPYTRDINDIPVPQSIQFSQNSTMRSTVTDSNNSEAQQLEESVQDEYEEEEEAEEKQTWTLRNNRSKRQLTQKKKKVRKRNPISKTQNKKKQLSSCTGEQSNRETQDLREERLRQQIVIANSSPKRKNMKKNLEELQDNVTDWAEYLDKNGGPTLVERMQNFMESGKDLYFVDSFSSNVTNQR